VDYLQRRWADGCHNLTKLFHEIRSQSYRGQRDMVAKFLSAWRKRSALPRSDRPQRFTPKQVAILTSKTPDRLTDDQRSILNRLSSSCPELLSMRALALDFRDALASKNRHQMLWWIQNAKAVRHRLYGAVCFWPSKGSLRCLGRRSKLHGAMAK
jgi:hypothetical protein